MLSSIRLARDNTVVPSVQEHGGEQDEKKKLRRKSSSLKLERMGVSESSSSERGVTRDTDVGLDQTSDDRIKRYRSMVLLAEDRLQTKRILMPSVESLIEDFREKLKDPWWVLLEGRRIR